MTCLASKSVVKEELKRSTFKTVLNKARFYRAQSVLLAFANIYTSPALYMCSSAGRGRIIMGHGKVMVFEGVRGLYKSCRAVNDAAHQ